MFLPAELATEDMNTRLSLLVQKRFGLGLTYRDQATRSLDLPVFHLGERGGSQTLIEAHPTHDGYYAARIPIAAAGQGIAVQWGTLCHWVEIASITASPIGALEGGDTNDLAPVHIAPRFDAMREYSARIFECEGEGALMLVLPDAMPQMQDPGMIEIVLRPLRLRGDKTSYLGGAIAAPQPTQEIAA